MYVLVLRTTSNITPEAEFIFIYFLGSLIGPQLSKQVSSRNLLVSFSSELGLQVWVTALGFSKESFGPHAYQTSILLTELSSRAQNILL